MVIFSFLLLLLFTPLAAGAHEPMEFVASTVEISPQEAPKIDGRLDEDVWRRAEVLTNFTQREPFSGAPATEESRVYFLFDENSLYVGCRLFDTQPHNIISELGRRESIYSSDRISLYFDTFHNHRTGYRFAMNPYGVQEDGQISNDDQSDSSWDAVWKSAARIDSLGWVAEFEIPFFNLRFPEKEEQIWGFNLERGIRYKAEAVNWKPISIDDSNVRMSRLGHLVGLRGVRRGRNIELYPYGLSGFSEKSDSGRDGETDVGFDARYGLTSDVTLDLTVNPDFAQVEADVLEVNLTRFPTRFPEKRKFFLEGTGIFNTPIPLFYTRRIGARGDILWGTKLTGRTEQRDLEYGLLASQTGDWNYFGLKEKDATKEEARYGVASVRKGFANGSSVGAILTGKDVRDGDRSHIAGFDGRLLFGGVYRANFQVAASDNPGLAGENKYYSLGIYRFANPWTFRITTQRTEPEYDINSTGFMGKERYRGRQNFRTVLVYNPLVERMGIRQVTVFSSGLIGEDLFTPEYVDSWKENNRELSILRRFEEGEFEPTYWIFDQSYGIRTTNEMSLSWWYGIGRTNELTHIYRPRNQGIVFSSPRSGRWQKITANLDVSWGSFYNFSQKYLGRNWRIGGNGRSWVRDNLGIQLSGDYTRTFDPDDRVDGKYYRLTLRNTYLATKDLFLRVFTQGRWGTTYYGEKKVANRYLASVLLGWEFSPGSWFYLAYNEGREDFDDLYEKRDFAMTSRTLVAKVQYAFFR
jgi:hypothetical protein